MVNVVVGIFLGFLSGLGIGGGSLLLLWLTLVVGTDAFTARVINLLFFLPAALVSCYFRWKKGTLEPKRILPAIFTGCLGAALGTWIAGTLDTRMLKKGFGILLIVTGIRELCYQQRNQGG